MDGSGIQDPTLSTLQVGRWNSPVSRWGLQAYGVPQPGASRPDRYFGAPVITHAQDLS